MTRDNIVLVRMNSTEILRLDEMRKTLGISRAEFIRTIMMRTWESWQR